MMQHDLCVNVKIKLHWAAETVAAFDSYRKHLQRITKLEE